MNGIDLAIAFCCLLLGVVVLFGQAKLFEIANTLKEIKNILEKEEPPEDGQ